MKSSSPYPRTQKIIDALYGNGALSLAEIVASTGVSELHVKRTLNSLFHQKVVEYVPAVNGLAYRLGRHTTTEPVKLAKFHENKEARLFREIWPMRKQP